MVSITGKTHCLPVTTPHPLVLLPPYIEVSR